MFYSSDAEEQTYSSNSRDEGSERKDEENKRRKKENFDRHHGARELSDLSPGDSIWLPDQKTEAVVGEKKWLHNHVVITPGGVTRRNRRDVIHMDRKVERVPPNTSSVDNSDGPTQTSSSPDRDIHQQQDSSSACQEHTPVQPELCRSRNSYTPTWN